MMKHEKNKEREYQKHTGARSGHKKRNFEIGYGYGNAFDYQENDALENWRYVEYASHRQNRHRDENW